MSSAGRYIDFIFDGRFMLSSLNGSKISEIYKRAVVDSTILDSLDNEQFNALTERGLNGLQTRETKAIFLMKLIEDEHSECLI